jgi:uncharacterized protein YodC (DUF2158 family)
MSKGIGIGDVVKLKSGGPLMTVLNCGADPDYYDCIWFNGGVVVRFSFSYDVLLRVKQPR